MRTPSTAHDSVPSLASNSTPSCVFNTFKPCLSWSSFATFSFHFNISAGTYPLPPYHTLHVSKPTQSTSPHHLHHTLNSQTRAQVLTPLPLRQLHPTHPSYHPHLIAL